MKRLTGCCGCFDLRSGSRAIGITLLVLTSLALIGAIISASDAERRAQRSAAEIAFQFVQIALHAVFNALLVSGVGNERRAMILAWLIYTGIVTSIQSVAVLVLFVLSCMAGVALLIVLVLVAAALVAVFWYWFVVVLHYYQQLTENAAQQPSPKDDPGAEKAAQ